MIDPNAPPFDVRRFVLMPRPGEVFEPWSAQNRGYRLYGLRIAGSVLYDGSILSFDEYKMRWGYENV